VALSNLAAAARVDRGRANFDVGDATAYGGSLIGRVALSEKGVDGGFKVQLSARKTNFSGLFDAIGLTGPLPRGHRVPRSRGHLALPDLGHGPVGPDRQDRPCGGGRHGPRARRREIPRTG
jgi:hypothetical protein